MLLLFTALPVGCKLDQVLGGISRPICPVVLGRLIPRSVKNYVDRLLNVLSFGLSTVDNLKFSGSSVLLVVYYGPGSIFLVYSHI